MSCNQMQTEGGDEYTTRTIHAIRDGDVHQGENAHMHILHKYLL